MDIIEKEPVAKTVMQLLLLLPVCLLVLACVLSMSKLLVAAVIARILLCWYYKRSYSKKIFSSKLFKQSVFFMSIYLLLLLIPTIIMQGNVGEIGHYAERMLPFFLLLFVADESTDIWSALWLAVSVGLLVICVDTLTYMGPVQKRLAGYFGKPNSLGGILALYMPLCYFGIYKFGKNKKMVVYGSLLLLTAFILMVLTQSRGAFLGWLASVFAFSVGVVLKNNWGLKKISSYITVVLLLLIAFSFVTKDVGMHFDRSIAHDGRIKLLIASGKMFVDHPIVGVGIGNWMHEYDTVYGVANIESHMASPHNIFLQVLNEAGIIGLSGFLALLGFQYYYLLRLARGDVKSDMAKLQWPFAILLTYVVTIVHGQVDYIFFQRGYQMFYWLLWGVFCWDFVYKKVCLKEQSLNGKLREKTYS